ncbi:MAG TPA: IclR family transcriptional regulator C-terminal domain-containing protein, partial [Ilumatobacteraceae bacterium]|nr:IclR family transcriptional regulator C-terminal domain-containing protein [Ilumatobacteraceae bacterium]
TDHTITDSPRLLAELAESAERGWTTNDNEHWPGVRALAVPIEDGSGNVTAALGVQGPSDRLSDERLPEVVAALQTSAHRLSLSLPITTF